MRIDFDCDAHIAKPPLSSGWYTIKYSWCSANI